MYILYSTLIEWGLEKIKLSGRADPNIQANKLSPTP
jgi:hypothetical protein